MESDRTIKAEQKREQAATLRRLAAAICDEVDQERILQVAGRLEQDARRLGATGQI
jgi:hypothetical protein